ncbi:hypothetical protein HPO96_33295 [Kribbella sandramycini]|uniref:Uncharacterized protein n=1 Tax=Kribbella sandramycini TaxID=60450 RepID=A0A7Y4L8J5_9ACTN|nr:hypothetical protein [Kribbella sandramycini]MBB6566136.1 hypothetical protein [Kribbella sandramycini]NOL45136.1 hypothetical protein [Kribbella sandramycini]
MSAEEPVAKGKRGRPAALVAAVAVAAVAIGAALAYNQSPGAAGAEAAPLSSSVTPKPASTTLDVTKLPTGRTPQIPYLVGRSVRLGAGSVATVDGTGTVTAVGRLHNEALAVVMRPDHPDVYTSELQKLRFGKVVRRTPGVTSLVTTPDEGAAAYAAARIGAHGQPTKGGVLFAETDEHVLSLKLPDSWNVEVLAYTDGKVYYRTSDDTTESSTWRLHAWTPGEPKSQLIRSAPSPVTVATDGKVKGFTPAGDVRFGLEGTPASNCSSRATAVAADTGTLLNQWDGCFVTMTAEDDQHLLFVAYTGPGSEDEPNPPGAIVRCTITTRQCELATPLSPEPLLLGS